MNKYFQEMLHKDLGKFNITQYKYLFFDRSISILPDISSTYPKELMKTYLQQKLYYTDPIINLARTTVKPFAWSRSVICSSDQDVFKLIKQHGIHDGYTFSISDMLGNSAFLNIACDEASAIDIAFFDAHCAELYMVFIELYDTYLKIKRPVDYNRSKIYLMLSNKELQVIKLGCAGLKYKDIALKLNISERTVKFHMKKIVDKFNTNTAKEAFLIAKSLNII